MPNLEGRISWSRFLASQLPPGGVLLIVLLTAWSVPADWVVDGFFLLLSTAILLSVLIWLPNVVTRFRVEGGKLTFSRLGRRTRTVPLADVALVLVRPRANSGASVWLRDGSTLYLAFEPLANARDLADLLQQTVQPAVGTIEGCLNRSGVAAALVVQAFITSLLTAVSFVGCLLMAVGFHPRMRDVVNPETFLLLGCFLLGLCALGFYFTVLRYWIGCLRWFRFENSLISYRTVLSKSIHQRFVDEVESVVTHRPLSHNAEAGSWRSVRFRGGGRIRLNVGILQNASALYEALKSETVRRSVGSRRHVLSPVTPDHPLWPSIVPHLDENEQVYWIGRPVYRKLWNEMSVELVFGFPFATFGIGGLVVSVLIALQDLPSGLFGAVISFFVAGTGVWMLAAPWRFRRLLRDAVYAVTSRRALVVHGLLWPEGGSPIEAASSVQSFDPDQIRNYEVVCRGRDISFGGEWRRGHKGRNYWAHMGFLAPDDLQAAESAIHFMLAEEKWIGPMIGNERN